MNLNPTLSIQIASEPTEFEFYHVNKEAIMGMIRVSKAIREAREAGTLNTKHWTDGGEENE